MTNDSRYQVDKANLNQAEMAAILVAIVSVVFVLVAEYNEEPWDTFAWVLLVVFSVTILWLGYNIVKFGRRHGWRRAHE